MTPVLSVVSRAGRKLSRAGVAAAAALALAGCNKAAPPQQFPPTQVGVIQVEPQNVSEQYEFVGEVEPFRRVEVRARVDGIIMSRPYTEGALVHPGDVLFRLDTVRYAAAYRSALARYRNAQRNLERLEPLEADNAVARRDVDDARTEQEQAEAAVTEAKQNLDDTVIRAELTGRVGRAHMELGARVTGPSDVLTTIDQVDPVYVSFHPSAQDLLRWRQDPRTRRLVQPGGGLRVEVTLPDGSELDRSGRLDYVDPVVDQMSGTQEFRARFSNADRMLVPGQFVRVRPQGFQRDSAIVIPATAVLQDLGRSYVFVVGPGDTVAARGIRPGQWSGERWVIDSGLVAGDRVVVDNLQKIGPGAVVKPVLLGADSAETEAGRTGAGGGAGA